MHPSKKTKRHIKNFFYHPYHVLAVGSPFPSHLHIVNNWLPEAPSKLEKPPHGTRDLTKMQIWNKFLCDCTINDFAKQKLKTGEKTKALFRQMNTMYWSVANETILKRCKHKSSSLLSRLYSWSTVICFYL